MKINILDGIRFETESLTERNLCTTLSARGSTVELRDKETGDVIAHQTVMTTPGQAVFQLTKIAEVLK